MIKNILNQFSFYSQSILVVEKVKSERKSLRIIDKFKSKEVSIKKLIECENKLNKFSETIGQYFTIFL